MSQVKRSVDHQFSSFTMICLMVIICLLASGCKLPNTNPGGPTPSQPLIKITPDLPARPTILPTQASEPTSTSTQPAPSEESFHDSFDSPNGWPEENTANYSIGLGIGGVYAMEFWLAGDTEVLPSLQPHQFALALVDMHLQAEGTAPDGNSAYGLVCRYTNPNNYYTFHIASNGNYWLYKRVNGNWTNLGSGPSNAIQENNSIDLWCVGNEISAAVNGTTVVDVFDDSLPEGNAGLFAQPLGGNLPAGQSYHTAFQYFEMTVYP